MLSKCGNKKKRSRQSAYRNTVALLSRPLLSLVTQHSGVAFLSDGPVIYCKVASFEFINRWSAQKRGVVDIGFLQTIHRKRRRSEPAECGCRKSLGNPTKKYTT
ncbi:unnamed protein product [Ixodes pacificus]